MTIFNLYWNGTATIIRIFLFFMTKFGLRFAEKKSRNLDNVKSKELSRLYSLASFVVDIILSLEIIHQINFTQSSLFSLPTNWYLY